MRHTGAKTDLIMKKKKRKKKRIRTPRLGAEAALRLGSRPIDTKKGDRGYSRARIKDEAEEEASATLEEETQAESEKG